VEISRLVPRLWIGWRVCLTRKRFNGLKIVFHCCEEQQGRAHKPFATHTESDTNYFKSPSPFRAMQAVVCLGMIQHLVEILDRQTLLGGDLVFLAARGCCLDNRQSSSFPLIINIQMINIYIFFCSCQDCNGPLCHIKLSRAPLPRLTCYCCRQLVDHLY